MLEQRIIELGDFVERDALGEPAEPERARIRNEMDVVTAARELEAELGRYGAGAAVRRVTGDPDSHTSCRSSVIGHRSSVIGFHRSKISLAKTSGVRVASSVHRFSDC